MFEVSEDRVRQGDRKLCCIRSVIAYEQVQTLDALAVNGDALCSICLSSLTWPEDPSIKQCVQLPCDHIFHQVSL